MSRAKDIQSFVAMNKVVKQAALDMYEDFGSVESRYTAWGIRQLKELCAQTLKGTGKRFVVLNINKNINSAVLPCDFKEEIFVGGINHCGEKIALNINPNIVSHEMVEEIPCDTPCDAKCECYPKQLCNDLTTTQVINQILLNDTYYDETVTTTMLPNGEYYIVTTTPILGQNGLEYLERKEYVTSFDIETCGCIKKTPRNTARLENLCWDAFCCYCTPCKTTTTDFGGYRIFLENGTIIFDGAMPFKKVYLEYRGFLPKKGNEYQVPEVAFECLVEAIKFRSVKNRKGVSRSDKEWHWQHYLIARDNMNKVRGRMALADIVESALRVPNFDDNRRHCVYDCILDRTITIEREPADVLYPSTPPIMPPITGACCLQLITVEGSEFTGGTTYNNPLLAGKNLRIFMNSFNRMLTPDEFTIIPAGGFTILTGPIGAGDWVDIYVKET